MEILQIWELQSESVVAAQSLSNLLLISYALVSLKINKGCFFVAFLFDELFSYSLLANILSESQYYLFIASIYCCLYWYIENKNMRLKTIVACGIIILFNVGMSIDAAVNSEIETIIYSYYIYFILFLHLYLICTLFSWTLARKNMDEFFRAIGNITRTSDAFTFIWYNSIIIKKRPS